MRPALRPETPAEAPDALALAPTMEDEPAGSPDVRLSVMTGAPAEERATARLRLVDAATGEALPHYEVRLAPGPWTSGLLPDASTAVVSDADGVLRLPLLEDDAGARVLVLLDTASMPYGIPGGGGIRQVPLPSLAAAHTTELAIDVGPTCPLEVRAQAEVAVPDVYASLVPVISDDDLAPGPVSYSTFEAPLRSEGGAPWVRFGPLYLGTPRAGRLASVAGPPWTLHFLERGRGYVGTAQVDGLVGVRPLVRVTLTPIASVRGTVRDAHGRPLATAGVQLTRVDRETPWTWSPPGAEVRPAMMLSDTEGRFSFLGIRPGPCELTVRKRGFGSERRSLDVRSDDLDLELTLAETAPSHPGRVSGTVGSRTGRFHESLGIVAVGPGGRHGTGIEWVLEEDVWSGTFRIDDLPDGSYRVTTSQPPVSVLVEPGALDVLLPADGLHFEVLDDLPRSNVTFRAVDATTGETLASCLATIAREDGLHGFGASEPLVPDLLEEGFAWLVSARGYVPAYGVPADLARAGDGSRSVEVSLEPGWGVLLQVLDGEGPVEGASVRLDGRLAGRTDAEGLLLLGSPDPPGALTVEHANRQLCAESAERAAQALRTGLPAWLDLRLCD